MTDLTAVGEIFLDLTETGAEGGKPLFLARPAGGSFRIAAAAAALGCSAAFLGKAGADRFGQLLLQGLEERGLDASGLRLDGETSLCVTASDGTRRFLRGADCTFSPEEVAEDLARGCRVLHFGSTVLTKGVARSAAIYAARLARRAGAVVSYAPRYFPPLWRSEHDALEWMSIPLPLVDVIELSAGELPLLTGSRDPAEGTRLLEERGAALAVVCLGGEGIFCRWRGETFSVPVPAAPSAAFDGALLCRLCRREKGPLVDLERPELEEILARAGADAESLKGAHLI